MHLKFKNLAGCRMSSTDGVIGRLSDLYFDNATWVVRFIVVETGEWLSSRKILVNATSIVDADMTAKSLTVSMSSEQIRECPAIDTDKPVARQHDLRFKTHFRYPKYWERSGLAGQGTYPPVVCSSLGYRGTSVEKHLESTELARLGAQEDFSRQTYDDVHLRSCSKLLNRIVRATDGDVGPVTDVLVDQSSWTITNLLVDSGHWWNGHPVLVNPRWILPWQEPELTLFINRTRASLEDVPALS